MERVSEDTKLRACCYLIRTSYLIVTLMRGMRLHPRKRFSALTGQNIFLDVNNNNCLLKCLLMK